ncbi:hypothetical protein A0H81_02911 [Grifola frondosa]|uniref:Uncharacterized protein n=1 Tax=Grifola frondosa TaxID=5627 RepID=A0A1C7MHK4_GRIFR|nr:hypothetical protein A0H81_02911 [Grifola frondosa]
MTSSKSLRSHWKWPTLMYFLSRLTALTSVICEVISLNIRSKVNCDALVRILLVCGYLAMALSTALIALRIIAIWNRKRSIMFIVGTAFVINVAFLLYGCITDERIWEPVETNLSTGAAMVPDRSPLLCPLCGPYIPESNDAMNLMFQTPLYVAMTICATRMHRGLYEYANPNQPVINYCQSAKINNRSGTLSCDPGDTMNTTNYNGRLVPLVHITRTIECDNPTSASPSLEAV